MVGLGGFEPPTSPLSGVRSNQLSYRPMPAPGQPTGPRTAPKLAEGGKEASSGLQRKRMLALISRMKGHEDDGNVLWNGRSTSAATGKPGSGAFGQILRKEVIQPQVPLRLPCYDFTPVAKPTVVACLPCGLAQRLRVNPTPMV